jgi:hypothetical protein
MTPPPETYEKIEAPRGNSICIVCGADKDQEKRYGTLGMCNAWGKFYGNHNWETL